MKNTLLVPILVLLVLPQYVLGGPSVTARENFDKLLKTRSCEGCDLSGLNFNRMDLSGVNLEGADLSLSTFFLANLSGANLKNAKCNGAKFGGADLGDSDLRGADLRGAKINSAYLGGAQMTGQIVKTKPYEDIGVGDIEKELYLEDQTKPKKRPELGGVKVGKRRDLGEIPPSIDKKSEAGKIAKASSPPRIVRPDPPAVKKITPVGSVLISEESVDTGSTKATGAKEELHAKVAGSESDKETFQQGKRAEKRLSDSTKKEDSVGRVAEKSGGLTVKEELKEPAPASQRKDAAGGTKEKTLSETKMANLEKLLDKNRCYGCDLSGLDLSGKDLEDADLEKADLSNADLTETDLEDANLKGASLKGAKLVDSDLEGADFYKADLGGADLSGARQKNTMFDGAKLDGAIGVKKESVAR